MPDRAGLGERGSRRLGAALRRLKGPAGKLTRLLKGLDAAELMALGAPEAGYEVVYEPEAAGEDDHAFFAQVAADAADAEAEHEGRSEREALELQAQ